MLIEETKLKYWIDNFYGYGSWNARIWFISHEEGGGEVPEEVAEKVNHFYSLPRPNEGKTLCDIRDAYRHISIYWDGPRAGAFNNRYEYRFGSAAVQHGIWKNLIAFAHAYGDEKLPDLIEYQRNEFVSSSKANQALIPLYPLPSPHNHAWYYSWLDLPNISFLKNREMYQNHVYPNRVQTIMSNIGQYKPELVLMYGMENINQLKQSILDFFPNTNFKMVKSIKQVIPQHHRVEIGNTILLITTQIPALRHNRVETGFDWFAFGKSVKS